MSHRKASDLMTAGSSVVKLTAKTALKGNWLKNIIASATVIFSYLIFQISAGYIASISNDAAAYIFLILSGIFVLSPLILGIVRYFWRFICGAEDDTVTVFYYFSGKSLYFRALHLTLSLFLRALGFGVLLFAPSIITDIFSGVKIYDMLNIPIPMWTSNLYYASVFLKTIAVVVLLFIMARYYLAPVLAVADEKMDIAEAVHMSCIVSRMTLLDFICFIFSFLGWFIISVLVFPLIFVMPYFLTSYCVHSRFAVAEYNKRIEKMGQSSFPSFAAGI